MKNSIEEDINRCNKLTEQTNANWIGISNQLAIKHILSDYKRVLKENETYKNQYFGLIDKIENKIDKFDYEFEKAKRKNDNNRANYYWDLIINFKKMLESEE